MGFFNQTSLTVLKEPPSLLPRCGSCGLFKNCQSPKMKPSGKGRKRILIVGEAPGANEDVQGIQFIGKAGQFVRSALEILGINTRRDVWWTYSLICGPHEGTRNRTPTDREIDYCRPNLTRTIKELNPDVILLLGKVPLSSCIKPIFPDIGELGKWTGQQIPCRQPNAWICPTWHPSYLIREGNPILDREWERHLKAAVELTGKPWQTIPDYSSQVKCLFDPEEAARAILAIQEGNRPIAWDLETEGLKPDRQDFNIVTCSVSDGITTFAFPWVGVAIDAMKELLRSDLPKWGWNAKFEDRWIRSKLGIRIRNWQEDGMLNAHALDNRSGVTGLDFQAFVQLGQETYDKHIRPFLKSKRRGGNERNRIKEVDLKGLLQYNGLDSLLTWKIVEKQRERIGKCKSK